MFARLTAVQRRSYGLGLGQRHSCRLQAGSLSAGVAMVTSTVSHSPRHQAACDATERCQRIFLARHGERADLADTDWANSEQVTDLCQKYAPARHSGTQQFIVTVIAPNDLYYLLYGICWTLSWILIK